MFEEERRRMVETQIKSRGLSDPRLLNAFETVPRHLFVRESDRVYAYADGPLSIGFGQTISQPYIVALMTDLLKLCGEENVLEVGTGSGYQAAILSHMAKTIHTIEFEPRLSERAEKLLADYDTVHCHNGDGSLGWTEAAPYEGIIVTAAAPSVPPTLLDQLKDGGRLVLPVGVHDYQFLEVWTRHGDDFDCKREVGVAFVLLRGEFGWK